jgi:hypothetical protein
MDIKYPPLINVSAEIKNVKMMLGQVVIEVTVKGKPGTIVLARDEAKSLRLAIKAAMTPPV